MNALMKSTELSLRSSMNQSAKLKDISPQVSSPLVREAQRRNATIGIRPPLPGSGTSSPIRFRATAKTWTEIQPKQQPRKHKPSQLPRGSTRGTRKPKTFVFKDFIPPGAHYFYFVKDGQQYCLSSQFLVDEYPGTNLRMNTVLVEERDWNIDFGLSDQQATK